MEVKKADSNEGKNESVLVLGNASSQRVLRKKIHGVLKANALIDDVTIWGGACLCLAEYNLLALVKAQRKHLRRFIYLPSSHRVGGRIMARPHLFYRTDQSSTMRFPSLTTLGYYEDRGTPLDALWIVPNLETLYVFEGKRRPILDSWNLESGNGDNRNLPQRVLEECPNLVEIICAKPDFSTLFRFQTLRRFMPPRPLSWECLRLLEVGMKKEEPDTCPVAMLPGAVVDRIVSFCHRPHWKIVDSIESNNSCDEEEELVE